LRGWSRGTGYELRFPGRSGWPVHLRRPADCRVHGPVTTRDRRSTSPSARWHSVWRTSRCWENYCVLARRWDRSTSPRRGTLTSLLGSRTFLGTIAPAPYVPFTDTHGPTRTWIQQFSVRDSNSYFQRLYVF
jgi:hypothetical protein